MDGGESPLDVLSRAATMVQENQQAVNAIEDSSKQCKQLPTAKWKRDRRTRAEYLRKSDPKLPEGFLPEPPSQAEVPTGEHANTNGFSNADTPLDMSVRQRGQPPSYAQTISNPGYRTGFRASVITQVSQKDDMPSGISMCDPIIDEHFRRSLGKDYIKVFSANNNVPKDKESVKTSKSNGVELTDNSGMSVDDHFAKALGDTWLQLNNKKERELEPSEKDAVSV